MFWRKIAVRKPLAVYSVIWGVVICTAAFILNRDIPPGAVSIMTIIISACVGSYAASSAYETVCSKREEKPDE